MLEFESIAVNLLQRRSAIKLLQMEATALTLLRCLDSVDTSLQIQANGSGTSSAVVRNFL